MPEQDNRPTEQVATFLRLESETFKKARKKIGSVTFTCPFCGGTVIARRFASGQQSGGCFDCKFSYMM